MGARRAVGAAVSFVQRTGLSGQSAGDAQKGSSSRRTRKGREDVQIREEYGEITDKVPPGFKPVTPMEAGGSAIMALLGIGITGSCIYYLVSNLMAPEEQRVYARREYRPENQPGRVDSSYPPRF